MGNANTDLTKIRQKIDAIDLQIQHLINQRAEYNIEVARLKQKSEPDPIYYRPEREAQILKKIMKRNSGPLPAKAMAEIFLHILSQCRALQKNIKIAIPLSYKTLGIKSARKHFGLSVKTEAKPSIRKIFQSIYIKNADYGIVPIEENKTGANLETLNQLLKFPMQICGEIISTTKRFWIIGAQTTHPSGNDKTTLVVFVANKPGSLAHILEPFAKYNIDISFIEYFPYQENLHNYVFFLDLIGHEQDEKIKKAFDGLANQNLSYRVLGAYPKAVL